MSKVTNTDSPPNSSLVSNLRHFRFQKKTAQKTENVETHPISASENEDSGSGSPLFKRGKSASVIYSDSEEESNPPSNEALANEATIKSLKETFPNITSLEIENTLINCKGDISAAKEALEKISNGTGSPVVNALKKSIGENFQNITSFKAKLCDNFNKKFLVEHRSELLNVAKQIPPPVKRTLCEAFSTSQHSQEKNKRAKKDKKALADYDESGDSDDDLGYKKQDKRVFNSDDDSDVEISDVMDADQKQVYEFLSSASLSELLCMPNCSQKKAEAIIEQRPFTGWKNMVEKFQEGKNLGTEILNYAQDVLFTRQVVNQLMQKCTRLAVEMERAVSVGASGIKEQPKLLSPRLKLANYQMVGLNWLLVLHYRGLNGILADEMGLGKTVQIIAFLAHLQETAGDDEEHTNKGPHLIVVPSSTMDNWSNELERWCPSLKVIVYYGSMDERKMMRIRFSQEGVKDVDIILTTYNLITGTPEERKMFKVLPFNYVIFDEAHMLKNMNTQRFENLMRVNAKHRILVTGTPLQNNLLELMSLLTFVMPNMFAKKKEYLKCLFTKNTKTKMPNDTNDSLPRFEQEQVAQAKRIMQPFVLRRLKKDVLKDLPEKKEEVVYCPMVERQQERYTELVTLFSKKAEKREVKEDMDEMSGMTMMMDLRKLSNHPLLIRDLYDEEKIEEMAKILAKERDYKETNVEYIKDDLRILSDFQIHALAKSFTTLTKFELDDEYILMSGKFELLDKMLPKLKEENHRVLIFSQFVIMLNVLEEYLNIRGYKFLRLDGSTQVTLRQELIDTFNQDPSIFIFMLSTRAGGLGINLTAADTVIIHDIDFNPYNDKQAEDRCHRVGQTRPVSVMRFITKDSIEENIYQVALEKLTLEREISEENEQSETKSFVKLLKKALGMGSESARISPSKKDS